MIGCEIVLFGRIGLDVVQLPRPVGAAWPYEFPAAVARRPRAEVRDRWGASLFLRDAGQSARGWLIEVMKAVEDIERPEFTLAEVYTFEPRLAALFPRNHNVRPKIRQQLQVLRDVGWLEFTGKGTYRRGV